MKVLIDADGEARVQGEARIQDGSSTTTLAREPASAQCNDVDQNGRVGLTLLTFTLRDVRTGDLVKATVVPDDGEADTIGVHRVTMVVGTITTTGTLRIRSALG